VILQGWIRTRRDSKAGFSFLEINDGSCFGNIQVLAEAGLPNYESEIKRLSPGCSVSVTGLVKASPARAGNRSAGDGRHRPRMADVATYRCRRRGTRSSSSAPSPFCGRGRTPSAPSPACGTASATRSTSSSRNAASSTSIRDHHRQRLRRGRGDVPSDHARLKNVPKKEPEKGGRRKSTPRSISSTGPLLDGQWQLEAEIFACGLGKSYTFAHLPRENSNTPRHLAEFWMVEPEWPTAISGRHGTGRGSV